MQISSRFTIALHILTCIEEFKNDYLYETNKLKQEKEKIESSKFTQNNLFGKFSTRNIYISTIGAEPDAQHPRPEYRAYPSIST